MKSSLVKGVTESERYAIDKVRTIDFMGEALRVYATPSMVRDVEETCRLLIQRHLDDGEETVGAHVEIDHLGATLLGMEVTVTATVAEVDGRRVTLDAEVRDPLEVVGRAKHVRFVIDRERQKQRLEAKAAKVRELGEA